MPPRRPDPLVRGPGAAARPRVGGLALCCAVALAACGGGASPAAGPAQDGGTEAPPGETASETAHEVGLESAPPPSGYPRPRYRQLSETGLYTDFSERLLAPGVRGFQPTHQLWSDGAEKRRWLRLPPGTRIDTSDIDHWQFPVGTKLWKEFARQGAALETRLIERYGPGPEDYWMGSFVWAADASDATFAEDGSSDIHGTTHDAPSAKHCLTCHRGEPGRVLGLSAVQLAHDGPGLTLAGLASDAELTHPPPGGPTYQVPGDATTAGAFGYLHANCGHCHNRNGAAWPDTQGIMRLGWQERVAEETGVFRTLVGQRFSYWRHPTLTLRVSPGDGDASAVLVRMKIRGSKDQMPPLATELVDPAGVELLARWIAALPVPPPPDGGGPADAGPP